MREERKNTAKENTPHGTEGIRFGHQVWTVKSDKKANQDKPCIWMASGVVAKKQCNNFFDCTSCKYDAAMEKQVALGKQIRWQDAMRREQSMDRMCRHSLTLRMEPRVCAYNYNCASCDFDQYFEDVLSARSGHAAVPMHRIKGFQVPEGYYFHNGHTWAMIESGGRIRVGLDDFSLKLLGTPDALDLPLTGNELNHNIPGWGLRRDDHSADVLSPVDGVITEVNENVRKNPGRAGGDPYGDGWLFIIHNSDIKGTFNRLMDHEKSMAWTGEEVNRLEGIIESVAGPMATDGGLLMPDIYGNLPELDWRQLTRTFLRNG